MIFIENTQNKNMKNHNINTFLPNWKSVVYIFFPGWIAFIPILVLLNFFKDSLGIIKLFESYEYLFVFCLFNSVLIGLLINELGSWVEGWFDVLINCSD
jgi:hypothetical protein